MFFFSVHPMFPHAMLLWCITDPHKNMFYVVISEHLETLKTLELHFLRHQCSSHLSHGSFNSQFLSNFFFYSHRVMAAVARAKATHVSAPFFLPYRVWQIGIIVQSSPSDQQTFLYSLSVCLLSDDLCGYVGVSKPLFDSWSHWNIQTLTVRGLRQVTNSKISYYKCNFGRLTGVMSFFLPLSILSL